MAETERQLQRFFMNRAFGQAKRSKCLKLKVGAVVVKDNITVGWGVILLWNLVLNVLHRTAIVTKRFMLKLMPFCKQSTMVF